MNRRLACLLAAAVIAHAAPGAAAEKPSRPRTPSPAASRTLADVRIEGEVPMPQVLFVSAREQRRVLDFSHRRYLEDSQQVGARVVPGSWAHVAVPRPRENRKESPR